MVPRSTTRDLVSNDVNFKASAAGIGPFAASASRDREGKGGEGGRREGEVLERGWGVGDC